MTDAPDSQNGSPEAPQGEQPGVRRNLEARIQTLEEQARFTLDVLEMAATLGDFQTSINKLSTPEEILRETIGRVQGLIHFLGSAFLLVDEDSSDFRLALCEPERYRRMVAEETGLLIDNGIFSLAIRENRPIIVYSSDKQFRLVVHVLATSSRTRGMFVGLLSRKDRTISGILLSLLSIILKNCANAIESFELYRLYRENELRLRAFADALPHGLFETDLHGDITSANAALAVTLGHSREDLCGKLRFTDILDEASAAEAARVLETCRDPRTQRLTVRAVTGHGEEFPALLHLTPRLEEGRCLGFQGVLVDLSDVQTPGVSSG